ncbi:MAG: hypothetical protein FJX80_02900 [Bacteroidetes bacterium]|nr:hypothetical protein [Bacteroidota bacterium]
MKACLGFFILLFNFNNTFCQIHREFSFGTSYVSSQYDIFHNVGLSLKKNKFGFNQEIGLSHKYLEIGQFNWRFQEQFCYDMPLSKRFAFQNGLSVGLSTQLNNSGFYRLDENVFFGLHFKDFLGVFLRNYVGIMHQMKRNTHLFTKVNFATQIGVSYDF